MASVALLLVRCTDCGHGRSGQRGRALDRTSWIKGMAGTTGLEPATSDVTGRRSNQLNYVPEV